MTSEQALKEFKAAGALLEGHFILSSGLHSDTFLQKALVFQDAKRTARLCGALATKVRAEVKRSFTAVVSPAVGGIVPGYEMGRQLGAPAITSNARAEPSSCAAIFTWKKEPTGADG